jgi:hypothetical protein
MRNQNLGTFFLNTRNLSMSVIPDRHGKVELAGFHNLRIQVAKNSNYWRESES